MNKKTFIIGANFGPFSDDTFIYSHKEFFSLFEDVCLRDRYSFSLFKERQNVRVAPDVVFNLEATDFQIKEKSVGFSLINLQKRKGLNSYTNQYNDKMVDLIEHYIKLGYKAKLFSFCEREGDLVVSNFIKVKVNEKYKNNIEVVNYNGNIEKFLSRFQACEIIIGTRFHSIILAIIYNQRLLRIIYSDKTYNMLKDLNLEKNSCFIEDINNLDVENIVPHHSAIQIETIANEAESQFKALDLFLDHGRCVTSNMV